MVVAYNGAATLELSEGSRIVNAISGVGRDADGTVKLHANSEWTTEGRLFIGYGEAAGLVTVDGGGPLKAHEINLAGSTDEPSDGTGKLEITTDGVVTVRDIVRVWYGGVLTTTQPHSPGGALVISNGTPTVISEDADFVVSGQGQLQIMGGGIVESNEGHIDGPGGTSVLVRGGNYKSGRTKPFLPSTWGIRTSIDSLIVGETAQGGLQIDGGGQVNAGDVTIGSGPNADGFVLVTGAVPDPNDFIQKFASALNGDKTIVGKQGQGRLKIADGGFVFSIDATVGAEASGVGGVRHQRLGFTLARFWS